MVNKYFEGKVPKYCGTPNEVDNDLEEFTQKQIKAVEEKMANVEISNAISEIWSLIARTNKYIDETTPWTLAKEENTEKLESCMYHLIEDLREIAILITPFMPDTAESIFRQIGVNDENMKTWDSLSNYTTLNNIKVIEKGEPLFMRLDVEEEIKYIKMAMKK